MVIYRRKTRLTIGLGHSRLASERTLHTVIRGGCLRR